ncbi:hypothetical protein OROMI_017747 [Orobanche minor]
MQAIKEKLSDMSTMRQAKAEAKEEEKAEKELAKARVQVAHEVRMAREAEAAMDLHVNKAAEKVAEVDRKYQHPTHGGHQNYTSEEGQESYGRNPNSPTWEAGTTANPINSGAVDPSAACYGGRTGGIDSTAASAAGTGYTSTRSGGPPTNNTNNLL